MTRNMRTAKSRVLNEVMEIGRCPGQQNTGLRGFNAQPHRASLRQKLPANATVRRAPLQFLASLEGRCQKLMLSKFLVKIRSWKTHKI